MESKDKYLVYRRKLIHKLNRATNREQYYNDQEEQGLLSKYGYQTLGDWQGKVSLLEVIIDELDELYGLPRQDVLKNIEVNEDDK